MFHRQLYNNNNKFSHLLSSYNNTITSHIPLDKIMLL